MAKKKRAVAPKSKPKSKAVKKKRVQPLPDPNEWARRLVDETTGHKKKRD